MLKFKIETPKAPLRVDTLRLLYPTEASGCLNWLLIRYSHGAAVSSRMLEFV